MHSITQAVILAGLAVSPPALAVEVSPVEAVRGFLRDVRSGARPEAAAAYFAETVAAHQVTSEGVTTISRTPAEYAEHVREFRRLFGKYTFEVQEMIAQGGRVYVRWRQTGHHLTSIDGEEPTGKPLIEISSAVYRVSGGRIVEYWIQTDRKGLELQIASAVSGTR